MMKWPESTSFNFKQLAAFGATACALLLGASAQAGERFEPSTVEVPSGSFLMGCVSGQQCQSDEQPVHRVQIGTFRIGTHEVTFDQWDACVNDGGCSHRPESRTGRGDRPVTNVGWRDIQEYLAWLGKRTGKPYRLPSEAEWEYAARAGTTTLYSFGDDISSSRASYISDAPRAVGSFVPNTWGLYDMHGNVWEVLDDCWNDSYRDAPTDGSAWTAGDCSKRVVRSGAFNDDPDKLRSANRYGDGDNVRDGVTGFRVALGGSNPAPNYVRASGTGEVIKPEMVYIPGGDYNMGCRPGNDCQDDEQPVHRVNVASFEMGRYEVTFEEWDACYNDGGCSHRPDDRWGRGRMPVHNVGWRDAQEFIAWLNARTGHNYRLPSEAEWEYAARAGTEGAYSFGSTINTDLAQYDSNQAKQVGSFAPNPWGLYDMHGNLWEVLEDCWNENYQGAPNDGSAWTDGDCSKRVVRSGAFNDDADKLRSANRYGDGDNVRDPLTGLRLARSVNEGSSSGGVIEPDMARIAGGSFYMGCRDGNQCEPDEKPVRRVSVQAFEMARHELTFAEWDACVADGGCSHRPEDRWGRDRQPVINVSWRDVQEYLAWINSKTGKNYRLLSEAEWEYATRAGSESMFTFGNSISTSRANYDSGAGTKPVGSFPPNAWGLYDVHGNVWEVLDDCWNESYNGAPSDGSAWMSGDCNKRVVRSGAWNDDPDKLRSANRYGDGDDVRDALTGVRLGRSL